jgi:hypothetical protein
MRFIRVFISSPGDAETERKRAVRAMERLNTVFAGTTQFKPAFDPTPRNPGSILP